MDKRELDRFCYNWEVRLRDTDYKMRRPKRYDLNKIAFDYSSPSISIECEDIDCYELIMPKANFHSLAEIDKTNKDMVLKSIEDEEFIKRLKRNEYLEIKIRNNVPAVQKAWENYCTLLNLVYHDYADKY